MHVLFMLLAFLHIVESYYQGIRQLPVSSLKCGALKRSVSEQYLSHTILFIFKTYLYCWARSNIIHYMCANINDLQQMRKELFY